MRGFVTASVAAAMLLGLLVRSQAGSQAGEEALAILDKAAQAHRSKDKDDKRQAYTGKNKGKIYVAGLELDFTQRVWLQPPGKFKETMEMNVMGQAVKVTTVFNGKEGWIKANDTEIKVADELLAEFKETAHWMKLGQLTGLKDDKDLKFSVIGEAQVNGKPAIGVKISKKGKKDIDFYFDKQTGLMAKTERRALDFQTKQEVTEERIVTRTHSATRNSSSRDRRA
ncbi:MAG: hypothetical protein L0Y71_24925 [Gemmataceae bacterium]|nr:hypothetical protein [Gemmataceae bacterium]